jgi:hypothetical protein
MVLYLYRRAFGTVPRIRQVQNSDLQWRPGSLAVLRRAHLGIVPCQRGLQTPRSLQTRSNTADSTFFITSQVLAFACFMS